MPEAIRHFSYGSNMHVAQMDERGARFRQRTPAVLEGYRFVMNKEGVLYPGYAVANVQLFPGRHVEGVVYELVGKDDLARIQASETGYDLVNVPVTLLHPQQPHRSETVQATVFVAQKAYELEEGERPVAPTYIYKILAAGEDVFTPEYREDLLSRYGPKGSQTV